MPYDEIASVLNACFYAHLEYQHSLNDQIAERCLAIYHNLHDYKPKAIRVETHLKKYGTCKCGARMRVYSARCVVCWRRECAIKTARTKERSAA